ncbi:hypothetical protein JaAD80_21370 [Janthinobacterium sp. AD80]|nr:hypothetical protein JaAD80_21370 [Janthinobacterium sp. AD80]
MALPRSFSGASGVPTLTAMTMSAPMARAMSTGRLRTSPPSTTRRLFTRTGENTPGTASEARIDRNSGVSTSSTSSPLTRSEATERNGNGSWLAGRSRMPAGSSRFSAISSAALLAAAGGVEMPLRLTPNSMREGSKRSSSRRRNASSSRGGRSATTRAQLVSRAIFSSSATEAPAAYAPPTTPPMLVPTTMSIGTCSSCSTLSTPICARPRAPPPDSTRAMRGRAATGAGTALAARTVSGGDAAAGTSAATPAWARRIAPPRSLLPGRHGSKT